MYLIGDYVGYTDAVQLDSALSGELVLGNLEGPWCTPEGKPRPRKAGPRVWNAEVLAGPRWAFTLANNHMMDFGLEGLEETQRRLRERGIPFVGAGMSLAKALRPMILEEHGRRIGVLACAEHQFGMAEPECPGIAPMGLWLLKAVRDLKQEVDVVIVSCHAAVEMSPIPALELREFYHALIDAGADVIHGHHAHVPQGWERYAGGYIFYGLGNFLIDSERWTAPNTRWSLVVSLDFLGAEIEAQVMPAEIVCTGSTAEVRLRPGRGETYLNALNSIFTDATLHRGAWQGIAVRLYHSLYEHNLGFYPIDRTRLTGREWTKRLYHAVRTLWAFWKRREQSVYSLVQYNYVQCESHRMLIAEAMGTRLSVRVDAREEEACQLCDTLLRPAKIEEA